MLVIRLARTGRRNQPKFRMVVAEHSKPVKGKVVEVVGHYDPAAKDKPLVVSKEVISAWIEKGAQPSNTVARLLNKNEGFDLPVHQRPPREPKVKKEEDSKQSEEPRSTEGSKPEEGSPSLGELGIQGSASLGVTDSENQPEEKPEAPVEEAKPESDSAEATPDKEEKSAEKKSEEDGKENPSA